MGPLSRSPVAGETSRPPGGPMTGFATKSREQMVVVAMNETQRRPSTRAREDGRRGGGSSRGEMTPNTIAGGSVRTTDRIHRIEHDSIWSRRPVRSCESCLTLSSTCRGIRTQSPVRLPGAEPNAKRCLCIEVARSTQTLDSENVLARGRTVKKKPRGFPRGVWAVQDSNL